MITNKIMKCKLCKTPILPNEEFIYLPGQGVHRKCRDEFLKKEYPSLYKLIHNK